MQRDEAIARIRAGLKQRSGKDWSVTGGRGTAWGWIKISAPPRRLGNEWPRLSKADHDDLIRLLNLDYLDGDYQSIPASSSYWQEYVDRAEGREPTVRGTQYWD